MTFDPHPAKVLRPQDAPHLLTATAHKIALIEALGVEHDKADSFAEAAAKNMAALQPIPRAGRTDDIARAVLFLASDLASFMTGTTISVDGGDLIKGAADLPDLAAMGYDA